MEQPTLRALGIAPYEGIRNAMAKEAEQFPQLQLDLFTGDLAEGAAIVQRLGPEAYDVIISRGGTAELIRQITQVPVVSIQISVYDILRTMKMAENYASKYAIVGFSSITKPAHTLCDLLQNNVDIITVYRQSEVESTLRLLRDNGCRGVVCDMVTHTCARELGMDAFLISSGAESIQNAYEQALALGRGFGKLRRENLYLHGLAEQEGTQVAVLDGAGKLEYSLPAAPSDELLSALRDRLPRISLRHTERFFVNHGSDLFQVTARRSDTGGKENVVFFYSAYQIPSHGKNSGIISLSAEECQHLFQRSFFNISGSLGEIEQRLKQMAATPKPVMILGEYGTGKEQIARALYLYSAGKGAPMICIDCTLVNEKSWDFLFEHEASPFHNRSATIYMKHLEAMPPQRLLQFLSILTETNLTKRLRLLFSCDNTEAKPLPDNAAALVERISCMVLTMPALRTRADEIPSLASLYLSSLNLELGKQLIGPDAQATRLLQRYAWPGNYVQFQNLLYELATVTEGAYIRSDEVSRVISRERGLRFASKTPGIRELCPQSLDDIILQAVESALEDCDGNQSQAAKQLGVSRSTFWRYLKRIEERQSAR